MRNRNFCGELRRCHLFSAFPIVVLLLACFQSWVPASGTDVAANPIYDEPDAGPTSTKWPGERCNGRSNRKQNNDEELDWEKAGIKEPRKKAASTKDQVTRRDVTWLEYLNQILDLACSYAFRCPCFFDDAGSKLRSTKGWHVQCTVLIRSFGRRKMV